MQHRLAQLLRAAQSPCGRCRINAQPEFNRPLQKIRSMQLFHIGQHLAHRNRGKLIALSPARCASGSPASIASGAPRSGSTPPLCAPARPAAPSLPAATHTQESPSADCSTDESRSPPAGPSPANFSESISFSNIIVWLRVACSLAASISIGNRSSARSLSGCRTRVRAGSARIPASNSAPSVTGASHHRHRQALR